MTMNVDTDTTRDEPVDSLTGLELLAREIRAAMDGVHWRVRHAEIGRIERVGDGVATMRGVPSVPLGELLERPDGLTAMAFDLQPHTVGLLFLDHAHDAHSGDEFRSTGRVASVRIGEELLGRVVDALGRPLDGGPSLRSRTFWAVERDVPGVIDRLPVREPMHTGIKVLDALLPVGRGQRELILGDRATGKTALALDAILAQRDGDVLCVYAAIGQRKATVAEVVETLRTADALRHTVVVVADAESPPGQQYLAPYAACTIGEYFMRQGRHVLVVYDDLTKHADAYRRIALLLGRPPGREAYPPDVFYLHARLLERATRLHDRLGGGSLTALPIATTQAGQYRLLHPDQPDLDHRRTDLSRHPSVQRGHSPGGRRRSERLAGRRQGPAAVAPRTGRRPPPALCAVARAGILRPLRRRAGAGDPQAPGARPSAA